MLRLESVTYRYAGARLPALTDAELTLGEGEVVGLVGANDAGKTTTCLVASGLAPRAVGGSLTGRVTIDGRDLGRVAVGDVPALVGMALASVPLSGVCSTVYEEVAFGPMNLGLPRNEVVARTADALEAVAIGPLADRDPEHVSGGQRQLVAIAGLLALRPRHLVMDEPTAHLDPAGTRLVGDAIERLAADGASILLTEQNTDLLARVCDRVVVVDRGRFIREGATAHVLADPALAELGVDPPTSVRLRRLAAAAGVDPAGFEPWA